MTRWPPLPPSPREQKFTADLEAIADRLAAGEIDAAEADRQIADVVEQSQWDHAAEIDRVYAARVAAGRRIGLMIVAVLLPLCIAVLVLLR